ncbi:MAG: hypothetical protein ACREDH_12725, partial [Methylocella sp.]
EALASWPPRLISKRPRPVRQAVRRAAGFSIVFRRGAARRRYGDRINGRDRTAGFWAGDFVSSRLVFEGRRWKK